MDERFITAVVTVLVAITGVAIIAVLVSRQSNTAGVLQAGGSSFGNAIRCALSPITGGSCGGVGIGLTESVNSTIVFQ